MKAWRLGKLGDPWDRCRVEDRVLPQPGEGVCRIKVEAADLNFADILQCQGSYQAKLEPPFTPGMGAAGTVLEAGDGIGFKVGDRIIGPTCEGEGGYAEECLVLADRVTVIPDDLSAAVVAAAHVTYGTAWFGLHLRGQLKSGETVLVLAAAGGVGSAAVELARAHGCWVVAAAGGKGKTDACLALGADEVIDYNSEDLYERVMALTAGRGVDVVYDPVGGEYFDVARRLVAWEGRYLLVGFASGAIPSAPMNHALVKNYSIVGVHMGGYRGRKQQPFDQCYEDLFAMLREDRIHPLVDFTVGFDGLGKALRDLADRKTMGRVMFDPAQD